MATAAARPSKDLGPDWRDRLRESLRRLVRRSFGILLVALSVAGAPPMSDDERAQLNAALRELEREDGEP